MCIFIKTLEKGNLLIQFMLSKSISHKYVLWVFFTLCCVTWFTSHDLEGKRFGQRQQHCRATPAASWIFPKTVTYLLCLIRPFTLYIYDRHKCPSPTFDWIYRASVVILALINFWTRPKSWLQVGTTMIQVIMSKCSSLLLESIAEYPTVQIAIVICRHSRNMNPVPTDSNNKWQSAVV